MSENEDRLIADLIQQQRIAKESILSLKTVTERIDKEKKDLVDQTQRLINTELEKQSILNDVLYIYIYSK